MNKFRSEEFEIGEIVNDDGAFVIDNTRSGYLTIEGPDGSTTEFVSGGDIWVEMDRVREWKASADECMSRPVLIFPEGVTLDEAKRLHAEHKANGGGCVQVSGVSREVFTWLMLGRIEESRASDLLNVSDMTDAEYIEHLKARRAATVAGGPQ